LDCTSAIIVVMSKWLAVLMLSLFSAEVIAAPRDWTSGTLISIDDRKEVTSGKKGSVIEKRIWAYSIDAGDVIYEAERASKRPIQIEINGPVSFALRKTDLYVKDTGGHEFKLDLLKTTRKKPAQ